MFFSTDVSMYVGWRTGCDDVHLQCLSPPPGARARTPSVCTPLPLHVQSAGVHVQRGNDPQGEKVCKRQPAHYSAFCLRLLRLDNWVPRLEPYLHESHELTRSSHLPDRTGLSFLRRSLARRNDRSRRGPQPAASRNGAVSVWSGLVWSERGGCWEFEIRRATR